MNDEMIMVSQNLLSFNVYNKNLKKRENITLS